MMLHDGVRLRRLCDGRRQLNRRNRLGNLPDLVRRGLVIRFVQGKTSRFALAELIACTSVTP
jgi:hypothetical protein